MVSYFSLSLQQVDALLVAYKDQYTDLFNRDFLYLVRSQYGDFKLRHERFLRGEIKRATVRKHWNQLIKSLDFIHLTVEGDNTFKEWVNRCKSDAGSSANATSYGGTD